MTYATDKYLKNVGIFAKWPLEEQLSMHNQTDANYLWLSDITEVIKKPYLKIKIRTDFKSSNDTSYTVCIQKYNLETCFAVEDSLNAREIPSPTKFLLNKEYNLHLSKEPAQHYKYIIGYIDYNINVHDLTITNVNGTSCDESLIASSLVYAKYTGLSFGAGNTYMRDHNGELGLYSYLYDLLAVDKFWRTGIVGCPMSGDLGPKLNKHIRLDC